MADGFKSVSAGINYGPLASDPANGKEGDFYFNSVSKNFKKYANGAWSFIGTGSGSGTGINYIKNPDAQTSLDWNLYNDSSGALPVDGTGGTPTGLTFVRNTSSPIEGDADFKFSKDAASRQGSGLSTDLNTIGAYFSDTGANFQINFIYKASANFIAGVSSDVQIYLYDITNAVLMVPTRTYLLSGEGKYLAGFNVKGSSQNYRLIFHIASTNANAWDLQFKYVFGGEQSVLTGPTMTDPRPFTMNITGTTSDPIKGTIVTDEARYSFMGKFMLIQWTYEQNAAGSAGSGAYLFGLPDGFELDTANIIPSTNDASGSCGAGFAIGASNSYECVVQAYDATRFVINGVSNVSGPAQVGSGTIPLSDSSVKISFFAIVPIKGMTSDTAVGPSGVIRISDILANGTRVTTDPVALGEYRSRSKDTASSNTFSDQAPTTPPTITDGIRLHAADYVSAQTSGLISLYDIFIGKNKSWKFVLYDSAGRVKSSQMYYDYKIISGTVAAGINIDYDETAGVLRINAGTNDLATITSRNLSTNNASGATSDGYFEVYVADNEYQIQLVGRRSELWLDTGAGHGSTNTKIRYLSNMRRNIGDMFTNLSNSTDGSVIRVNRSGPMMFSYTDQRNGANSSWGLSINSTQLTTSILSINADDVVQIGGSDTSAGAYFANVSAPFYANEGDLLYLHTDGAQNNTTTSVKFILKAL